MEKRKCPLCKSTGEHLRVEKEIKHCRTCGMPQEFIYHIVGSPDGKEIRIMCDCPEMIHHLSSCQPELLVQAGIKIERKP